MPALTSLESLFASFFNMCSVNLEKLLFSHFKRHCKWYDCRYQFSCSVVSDCDPMDCSTPGLLVHHQLPSLPKLMSIELLMPSNHLMLCLPLLFPLPIFPSIRGFSNESVLPIRWPKYWSFSFSISPVPMNIQD